MATYEQLSSALVKADAAGNVDDARAFAAEIRKLKTTSFEAPASRTNVRDESFLRSQLNKRILEPAAEVLATGQGVSKGIGDIMFGGQRLVGQGLQALGAQETGQALMQDAARRKAMEEANLAKYREAAPGAVRPRPAPAPAPTPARSHTSPPQRSPPGRSGPGGTSSGDRGSRETKTL